MRNGEIEGATDKLPEVGEYLEMIAKPFLEHGRDCHVNGRIVNTSRVASYEDVKGGRQITTQSGSIYFIEVIDQSKLDKQVLLLARLFEAQP